MKNAKTLPWADIGSDHQLLITSLRIKLKKIKSPPRVKRFNLQNITVQCCIETKNRFDILMDTDEELTTEDLWTEIKDAVLSTAKKHLPVKRCKKTTPWLSHDVIDLADERRKLKEAGLQNSVLYHQLCNEISWCQEETKITI